MLRPFGGAGARAFRARAVRWLSGTRRAQFAAGLSCALLFGVFFGALVVANIRGQATSPQAPQSADSREQRPVPVPVRVRIAEQPLPAQGPMPQSAVPEGAAAIADPDDSQSPTDTPKIDTKPKPRIGSVFPLVATAPVPGQRQEPGQPVASTPKIEPLQRVAALPEAQESPALETVASKRPDGKSFGPPMSRVPESQPPAIAAPTIAWTPEQETPVKESAKADPPALPESPAGPQPETAIEQQKVALPMPAATPAPGAPPRHDISAAETGAADAPSNEQEKADALQPTPTPSEPVTIPVEAAAPAVEPVQTPPVQTPTVAAVDADNAAALGSEVADARSAGAAKIVDPQADSLPTPPREKPVANGVPEKPVAPPRQLAALPVPGGGQWLRNSVEVPSQTGKPMIAIVIDDVGINQRRTRKTIGLPAPLTLSFIPYGYNLRSLVASARKAGHEILVHIPMEPRDRKWDPGPNALLTSLNEAEILRRLRWGLDQFDGYVGISNHMGSKFTAWRPGMTTVLREIRSRGLLFLDSWTSNRSLGLSMSRDIDIPSVARDIFIDHDISRGEIRENLRRLERIARRRGFAIGIGHPHDLTTSILADWIGQVRSRGVDLVPISRVVRYRLGAG